MSKKTKCSVCGEKFRAGGEAQSAAGLCGVCFNEYEWCPICSKWVHVDDTDGQACMCRECAAKSDDVAVRLRESARRIGEVVPYLVGNEIALNNCLGVDGHKLTLGLVITLLNKSRDTLQSLALTLQGDC